MPLFQSAVLNKYLKQQDSARVATAYAAFAKHFHDPAVQTNIRDTKEEQYEEGTGHTSDLPTDHNNFHVR
jgi:hypothetical protein